MTPVPAGAGKSINAAAEGKKNKTLLIYTENNTILDIEDMYMKIKSIIYLLVVCLLIVLTGCSFPGNIYLSFSWPTDGHIPDASFSCTAPGAPEDIAELIEKKGNYINTYSGTYNITYSYLDTTTRTLDFTLEYDLTVLGKEDAFYDIIIRKDSDPLFYKVPVGY